MLIHLKAAGIVIVFIIWMMAPYYMDESIALVIMVVPAFVALYFMIYLALKIKEK